MKRLALAALTAQAAAAAVMALLGDGSDRVPPAWVAAGAGVPGGTVAAALPPAVADLLRPAPEAGRRRTETDDALARADALRRFAEGGGLARLGAPAGAPGIAGAGPAATIAGGTAR